MNMTPNIRISIRNLRNLKKIKDVLPSIGRFLTTIFYLTLQALYIFGNLIQNSVEWRWPQTSGSSSGTPRTSRSSRMSSKYKEVLDNYFSLNTTSIIHFWKHQTKSSWMKMSPNIRIIIWNLRVIKNVLWAKGGS